MRLFEVVLEDEDGELDCLLLFLLRLPVGSEFEIVRRWSEDLNSGLQFVVQNSAVSVLCLCDLQITSSLPSKLCCLSQYLHDRYSVAP